MRGLAYYLLVALQFTSIASDKQEELVTVDTAIGQITGLRRDYYNEFLGIPFAQPPVGALRFKPPKPIKQYDNYQATSYGNECLQMGYLGEDLGKAIGAEDCLVLNVYVPSQETTETKKAVMVWIHGGGFTTGSANHYFPTPLLKEDVVVVLMNYRLGALGFTSFGNDVVSGNMGLRDQLEALNWVQQHIINFGGDPDRVTIFGESAGGISVSAHYTSPLAAGLFSAAIAQSGTMLMNKIIAQEDQSWRTTQEMAEDLKCSSELDQAMLDCLQALPVEALFFASQPNVTSERSNYFFPNSDFFASDPVLPYNSYESLLGGHFNRVPFMTGSVKNDGAVFFAMSRVYGSWDAFLAYAPRNLLLSASSNRSEITETERLEVEVLQKFYAGDAANMSVNPGGFMDLFTDVTFQNPDRRTAELVSEHVEDVYNYFYSHPGQNTWSTVFGMTDKSWVPIHADELMLQFDFNLNPKASGLFPEGINLSPEDETLREVMSKYWAQFAKTGNPNIGQQDLPVWEKFGKEKNYMELKATPEMKSNLFPARNLLIQRIINDPREAKKYN